MQHIGPRHDVELFYPPAASQNQLRHASRQKLNPRFPLVVMHTIPVGSKCSGIVKNRYSRRLMDAKAVCLTVDILAEFWIKTTGGFQLESAAVLGENTLRSEWLLMAHCRQLCVIPSHQYISLAAPNPPRALRVRAPHPYHGRWQAPRPCAGVRTQAAYRINGYRSAAPRVLVLLLQS